MAKRKKDSLLREAIADAKTVRETALANAKAALEEAFTPHLTSMLSNKLKHEQDEGDEDEVDEATDATGVSVRDPDTTDAYGSDEGGDAGKKGDISTAAVTEDEEADEDDELDEDATYTANLDSSDVGNADNAEPSDEAWDSADDDEDKTVERSFGEGANPGSEVEDDTFGKDKEQSLDLTTENEDADEDEVDEDASIDIEGRKDTIDLGLDEILKELEADIDDDSDFDDDSMDAGEFSGGDEDPGLGAPEEDEVEEGEEDAELDLGDEEDFEVDEDMYPDAQHSSPGKEAELNQQKGKPVKPGQPVEEGYEEDDDVDLSEVVREAMDADEDESDEEVDESRKVARKIASENKSLKGTLKEYRQAVKFLRSKLLEVNLLNAKLLYTNRLFKNYNMNVGQKMRVVETFDRATTLREAKLVYATLAESFRSGNSPKIGSKRTITEGLASRAVGSTKPKGKAVQQILGEGTDMAARFKKLAGITKK